MATFRLPFPMVDGRVHREEELTLARLNAAKNARASSIDTPASAPAGLQLVNPMQSIDSTPAASPSPQRRRIALPDPVAFRFLEEDAAVAVVDRRKVLRGYELYLVEQWACSRQSPTLVIVTYTGDPKHSVVVGVLSVPADEKDWSPRLRVYFRAVQQYARPKETEMGDLMVTNLSSFPSAYTVIPIPDGDIKQHRQMFIVNEDLKRLGCSGRSALTLSEPTPATQAKFLQLYKTSDRVSLAQSVLELVKLCQVALFIFGKLEQEYIDGLLCDVTESAINNWWTEIGSEYYNVEPTDGILGPTTVAALLGTLMGARKRLGYYGAPIAKDVFDIDSTKRGIGTFQKAYKLERTRRLDRQTLLKLHNVTAKAAAREGGWGVQKAVKSTIGEFGGKKGELVIGMVGGREKANIGDVETTDLDKFISLASGERAKWLWHGKPRRTLPDHHEHSMPDMSNLLFGREAKDPSDPSAQAAATRRTQSLPLDEEVEARRKEESPGIYSAPPPGSATSMMDSPGDREAVRKNVFKSVAGKVNDARSGLGRIRDAMGGGLRGHASRPSKDESAEPYSSLVSPSISTLAQSSSAALSSPVAVGRAFTWKNKPEEYLSAFKKEREAAETRARLSTIPHEVEDAVVASKDASEEAEKPAPKGPEKERSQDPQQSQAMEIRKELIVSDASVAGSVVDEGDLKGPILTAELRSEVSLAPLQRRHSIAIAALDLQRVVNEARYPRRLSFSDGEEAILRWQELVSLETPEPTDASLPPQAGDAEVARNLYTQLASLQADLGPWAGSRVAAVEALDENLTQQVSDVQSIYLALSEAYQRIKHGSGELLGEERAVLTEAVKDVDALVARLEYEISALVGRVQDVEEGVANFEAQVEDVERRAEELKAVLETESWLHWFVRTLTGIGTGPNITRGILDEAGVTEGLGE
ncbi:hypothetical protein GQ53DRAFT_427388 [Thozetella sp. PMI_491]|nr:hypothetical protein GQ53DRAFT_427388 [Thozetella sp. PMI_491]